MTYHVLNGDALIERFKSTGILGEIVIARECLIEGDLQGDTLPEFFQTRAKFITQAYNENPATYHDRVAGEFEKLQDAPDGSAFNLWFGYDLFCRANMWFVLSMLHGLDIKKEVYVVYPTHLKGLNPWLDFGGATTGDLKSCLKDRTHFSEADMKLGVALWTAYKNSDLDTLKALSTQTSPCFPYLEEVCQAHIDRFGDMTTKGRPERVIVDILQHQTSDFHLLFAEFSRREGIYGFGDAQVKRLYDKVLDERSTF